MICVAAIAYSNSFSGPFLFDNNQIILQDTRIHSVTADHLQRILSQPYWETLMAGLYRPLATFSYLLNYALLGNGENPAGYHWLNLLLHAANIALVYALGLAIFEEIPAAFLLCALWGLHPLATESVTNIVGRADLLAAFGVLAALLSYRMSLRSSGRRKAAWLAAVALAMTVGIFSKESAVVVFAAMVLYDLAFERAAPWRARLGGYAAAAAPCAVFFCLRAAALAHMPDSIFAFTDNPLIGAGFWTSRMTAMKVIGRFFGLLLWPANLAPDYSYNEIPLFGWNLARWEDWKAILSLLACAGAAFAAIRSWGRRWPVFFSIVFFFAALAPVSNIFVPIGSIMAERFIYLPSVGFWAVAVFVLLTLWKRIPADRLTQRRGAVALMGVILIALAARTYARNSDWLDTEQFWRSAVEAAPASYKARINLAYTLATRQNPDLSGSTQEADRALAILDALPDGLNAANAYLDAGTVYRLAGERLAPDADRWYRKSLHALLRSERISQLRAQRHRLESARRGKPGLAAIPSALYLEMARTYVKLGDLPHAVGAFDRGRDLESDPALLEEAASAYESAGDLRKSAGALVEAITVDPGRMPLTAKLTELYGKIDPAGCAVNRADTPPSLNLQCPIVHGDICAASHNVIANYLRHGQELEAGKIRRVAVEELGCGAGLLNQPNSN